MARIFRLQAFALAPGATHMTLSELRLWGDAGPEDALATISASHPPSAGTLANLLDGDTATDCQFSAADAYSSGFYIELSVPDGVQPWGVRLAAGVSIEQAPHAFDWMERIAGRWITLRRHEGLQAPVAQQWYTQQVPQVVVQPAHVPQTIVEAGVGGASFAVPLPPGGAFGDVLLLVVVHRDPVSVPARWALVSTVGPATTAQNAAKQWTSVYAARRAASEGAEVQVQVVNAQRRIAAVLQIDTRGSSVAWQVSADTINEGIDVAVDAVPTLSVGGVGGTVLHIVSAFWFASTGGGWALGGVGAILVGARESPVQKRQDRLVVAKGSGVTGLTAQPAEPGSTGGVGRIALRLLAADAMLQQSTLAVRTLRDSALLLPGSAPPEQGEQRMQTVPAALAVDVEFGGTGTIYGTVELFNQAGNLPLPRRVRLHRSRDGLLVRETWSDAQGYYRFDCITDRYKYDVIAWDHEGLQQSVVANDLTPEVMP